MRTLFLAAAAVASLACLAPAHAQRAKPRHDLSRYDASAAGDEARTLVLCDTTAFLATRPNLNANRILVHRTGRPYERLLGPDFVQNGQFYGESYERAFYRLRRGGMTRSQIAHVQSRVGRQMIREYGHRFLPNGFVRAQQRFCSGWLRGHGVHPSL